MLQKLSSICDVGGIINFGGNVSDAACLLPAVNIGRPERVNLRFSVYIFFGGGVILRRCQYVDFVASEDSVFGERWFRKDLDGSGCGIF
jgi:hypothetical protein